MYKIKRQASRLIALLLAMLIAFSGLATPMPVSAAVPAAIPSQIALSLAGGAEAGKSAVGINWITDPTVNTSEIIYGTSPTLDGGMTKSATMTTPVATNSILDNKLANFKAINSFSVIMQDLIPETKYYYKVGNSGSGYSAIASFTAPANPDGKKPFSFVIGADTQGTAVSSFENTGNLYNYIKANEPDAAFLIHTGDVVEDASVSDQWQYYFDAAQNLLNTLPIMASPGNHDGASYDSNNVQYKARLNYSSLSKPSGLSPAAEGTVYSFEYGDALFICLNSNASSADSTIQWDFVSSKCAATTKQWRIVYFHNATYDPGASHYQLDNETGKKLTDAGVDLVFNGHEHAYARTTLKTTAASAGTGSIEKAKPGQAPTYVIGGSIYNYGYSLDSRDTSWNDFFYDLRIDKTGSGGGAIYSPGVYGKVEVTSNALIYKAYYKATGSENPFRVIDTFTITKSDEITQPTGGGQAPTSVTFLYDSFKQESGKYIARFNWVTPITTKITQLYYAKKSDFASNGGKFTNFVVGTNSTVDNSSAITRANYNGAGSAYSVAPIQSHKAETAVLDPGTEYVYCVGDGAANVSSVAAPASFTTPASNLDTFNFLAITDAQQNDSSYDATLNNYTDNSKKALQQALTDFPNAAFIVSSGDQVNYAFDTWEWDAFFAANADTFARVPFYMGAGNHEFDGAGNSWAPAGSWDSVDPTMRSLLGRYNPPKNGAAFYGGGDGTERMVAGMDKMQYESSNYYFIYGDTLFMMLDYQDQSTSAQIKEQQDWMKSVAKQNPTKWRVAVLHKSLFGYRMANPVASWTTAFDDAGVDVVLMGHDHVYVRTKLYANGANISPQTYGNGTTYITNYPANSDRRGANYTKDAANVGYVDVRAVGPGYSNISISPTEIRVTSKGFDAGGSLVAGDSNVLITNTPRTPNLSAWTYPAVPQDVNELTVTAVTVTGIAKEGQTLNTSITPSSATASYKWESSVDGTTAWTTISGTASSNYTVKTADVGLYLRCVATGTGFYTGAATSTATAKVTSLAGSGTTTVKIGTASELAAFSKGFGTSAYPVDGKYELSANIDMKPVKIGTASELAAFSEGFGTSAYPIDGRYELSANIDMNNVTFASIGGGATPTPFLGTFNGKGYTISNLKIESSNNCTGLFSYISTGGRVVNLKLANADITGGSSTGAIAGTSTGTIENCSVEGKVAGGGYTGGIVGLLHAGTLQNCVVNAAVSGSTGGGLIGGTNWNGSGSPLKVRDITTGNVIRNNFVMGTIAGASYTGSVVGDMGGSAGCLLQTFNGNITANSVYAAANGKIAGYWSGSRPIIDANQANYYDSGKLSTTGIPTATAAAFAGKTAADLTQKANFEALGWDFNTVWDWDTTNSMPVLRVIDVPGDVAFASIGGGPTQTPFLGTFNGKGYTISNLKIESSNNCTGLFAYISTGGRVVNLKLANVDITGGSSTGAIAGTSTGTIENCSVAGKVTGGGYTGGIVGLLHAGTLQNCVVNAAVSGSTGGGLIGGTNWNGSGSPLKVRDITTGNVIRNNYVMGTTAGPTYTGSIVGDMGGSAGCLLKTFNGNVTTNIVNATTPSKIAGYWSGSRPIIDPNQVNYYDSEKLNTSGLPAAISPVFAGKTAADLAQKATFEGLGWDFNTVWDWDAANNVPVPRVIDVGGNQEDNLITIIASAGSGGTISPDGYVLVERGKSQKFTFKADNYFEINTVKIDGVENTAAAAAGEFTFDNVTAVRTIDVTFKLSDATSGVAPSLVSQSAYYNRAVLAHIWVTVNFGQGALGILPANQRSAVKSVKIMKDNALVFDGAGCYWFPSTGYGAPPERLEICYDDMNKKPDYNKLVPGTYDLVITFADLSSTVCTIPLTVENKTISELTVNGGTITVGGNAVNSPAQIKEDSQVTVTATVPNGQRFVKWIATGLANDSYTENPFTFAMPANQVTLVAVYGNQPVYSTTLTGPAVVKSGEQFALTYGVSQAKDVSAQDVTVNFNKDKFEFVSAEPIQAGTNVIANPTATGVRLLVWGAGLSGVINGDVPVARLNLKAKAGSPAETIAISDIKWSNGQGQVVDVLSSNTIVTVINNASLNALIAEGHTKLAAAIEGLEIGQYHAGSKARLQAALDAANVVTGNGSATQQQIDEAVIALSAALAKFDSLIITATTGNLNNIPGIEIGDLGIAAFYYGIKEGDAGWDAAKKADLNGDGEVGIYDLSFIARKILG